MSGSHHITDEAGRKWWHDNFGADDNIDCHLFAQKLLASPVAKNVSKSLVEDMVALVIDTTDADGKVNAREFDYFLLRFGPFDVCVSKCASNLFDKHGLIVPWFHGGASRQAAEKMLSEEGKYLVRFSERFPAKMTLAFSKFHEDPAAPGKQKLAVRNILIQNHAKGFCLETNPGFTFGHLVDVIKMQQATHPAESEIYKKAKAKRASSGYADFDETVGGGGSVKHESKNAYSSSFDDVVGAPSAAKHGGGGHAYAACIDDIGKNKDKEEYTDFNEVVDSGASSSGYRSFTDVAGGGGGAPKAHGSAYQHFDEAVADAGKAQTHKGGGYQEFNPEP